MSSHQRNDVDDEACPHVVHVKRHHRSGARRHLIHPTSDPTADQRHSGAHHGDDQRHADGPPKDHHHGGDHHEDEGTNS